MRGINSGINSTTGTTHLVYGEREMPEERVKLPLNGESELGILYLGHLTGGEKKIAGAVEGGGEGLLMPSETSGKKSMNTRLC